MYFMDILGKQTKDRTAMGIYEHVYTCVTVCICKTFVFLPSLSDLNSRAADNCSTGTN